MNILVFGKDGQLGKAFKAVFDASKLDELHRITYVGRAECDLANSDAIAELLNRIKPDLIINAAAYTAVDKAESEPEKANLINVIGPKNLAVVCKEFSSVLLHISTDFVFDGSKNIPYNETDIPNPTGVYGQTKLDGEKAIQAVFENYYIVRTSWVYSQFGNNFMKTMLRLASERDSKIGRAHV